MVDDTFRDELANAAGTNYFERFVNTWKARYETNLRSSIGPLANNFPKLAELSGLTKFTDQLIRMRSTIKVPELPPLHPEAPNIPRFTPGILQRPEVHHLQELREELAEQAAENREIQRAMVDSLQEIAMKLAEESPKSATANHLAWAAVILSALILTATLLTLFGIQL